MGKFTTERLNIRDIIRFGHWIKRILDVDASDVRVKIVKDCIVARVEDVNNFELFVCDVELGCVTDKAEIGRHDISAINRVSDYSRGDVVAHDDKRDDGADASGCGCDFALLVVRQGHGIRIRVELVKE